MILNIHDRRTFVYYSEGKLRRQCLSWDQTLQWISPSMFCCICFISKISTMQHELWKTEQVYLFIIVSIAGVHVQVRKCHKVCHIDMDFIFVFFQIYLHPDHAASIAQGALQCVSLTLGIILIFKVCVKRSHLIWSAINSRWSMIHYAPLKGKIVCLA